MFNLGDNVKFVPDSATVDTDPAILPGGIAGTVVLLMGQIQVSLNSGQKKFFPAGKVVNETAGETVSGYIAARDA